jgi:FAD/FMN-containing dehydrogenase
LARLLGAGEVLGDPLALALYNRDASMIEGACSLVAFPRNREQVAGCLAIAERHGLAVGIMWPGDRAGFQLANAGA